MGYGIKLLTFQSPALPIILKGEQDESRFWDSAKQQIHLIDGVNDKLVRLSCFTISFIGNCKELFNISDVDDDERDCWDTIYVWRSKYIDMEWCDLVKIIEPLINECDCGGDEDGNKEALDDLEILFSVVWITKTFTIY